MQLQKITPFLWYDDQAEEAADFYTSIFKNSKRSESEQAKRAEIEQNGKDAPTPDATVTSVEFEIEGQRLIAFNGGPHFKFTPAISLFVNCDSQEEVDYFWEKLCEGGEESQCGWLVDKFGLSWQIAPAALIEMLQDEDKVKARNVMEAMMQMHKIDIPTLREAYNKGA